MIGSLRAKRFLVPLLLGGLVWSSSGGAQTYAPPGNEPIRLTPPGQAGALPPAGNSVPLPLQSGFGQPVPPRIHVQEIPALDPASGGILESEHGGFPPSLWAGTSPLMVRKLVASLPTPTLPSLVRLERRLLLSAAGLPAVGDGKDSLLKPRVEKLWALGDSDGLLKLFKVLPDSGLSAESRRLLVEAALAQDDATTACAQLPALQQAGSKDDYPARLAIYCQFARGRGNEAGLGVSLLREQGSAAHAVLFLAAADALSGIPAPVLRPDSFSSLTGLDLAMLRLAKQPLPLGAGEVVPRPLLTAVATYAFGPADVRLAALERAEAVGLIESETLRKGYESIVFPPEELMAPVPDRASAHGRALAYRLIQAQTIPKTKADLILRFVGQGGDAALPLARALSPTLATLLPTAELQPLAPLAVRILLATGRRVEAQAWLALLQTTSPEQTVALLPLLHLAGSDTVSLTSTSLGQWRKQRGLDPNKEADARRISMAYSLLASCGEVIPPEEWAALLDGPAIAATPHPRPAIWAELIRATQDMRLGGAVLAGLVALGDGSPAQLSPDTAYQAITALLQVGLTDEAHAIAFDLALAQGL